MSTPQDELRNRARQLLDTGEVSLVIGHGQGNHSERTTPVFLTEPGQACQLVLNPFCRNNLAAWLTRKDLRAKHHTVALVADEPDIRAVIVLIQEDQVEPETVRVIGVRIDEPGNPDSHCNVLPQATLAELQDYLQAEHRDAGRDLTPEQLQQVDELEALPPAERWAFWRKQFDKCIRCYACRQACPMCYCDRCIAEMNQPQWIDTSAHPLGNFSWNVARAFHLAGRCINCGECERVCPVDIPLMALNRFLARQVRRHFDYRAGYDTDEYQPFASYKCEDDGSFIL